MPALATAFVAYRECPSCLGTGIDPHPTAFSSECSTCWGATNYYALEKKVATRRGTPVYTAPEHDEVETAYVHTKRARVEDSEAYESWCEQRDEEERFPSRDFGGEPDWGRSPK